METQTFDYIVVGAGSAGSVLANRLSANRKHRVLVLEAGRESHPWSRIPVGFAKLIENPAANWLYSSEPDAATGNRRLPVPRGKLLGGSSSINGMVFVRGQSQDYDTWAQLGNRGWSYREVLPIFRDMESYQGDARRRISRPQRPAEGHRKQRNRPALRRADQGRRRGRHRLHQGLQRREAGRHRHDPGDHPQRPPHEHRRSAISIPRASRPNLTIQANALTECLLLEGKRCVGVRYTINGQQREARAAREVDRQRRLDQFAAASGTVRHRPAGTAAKPRHRGPSCAQGRRREPARSLLAAHEMDGAALARHDLQRQGHAASASCGRR